jgi:hypothetical protein
MSYVEYIFQGSLTDRGWSERNGADTGDWNGSTSPRKEFGGGRGFMTDNWRRHRGGGEDEDGWRTATNSRSDKWGRFKIQYRKQLAVDNISLSVVLCTAITSQEFTKRERLILLDFDSIGRDCR